MCWDEFCKDGVAVLDEAAAQRVERREDRRVFEAQAEAQVRVAEIEKLLGEDL